MKILHVLPALHEGGVEQSVLRLTGALQKEGCTVEVVSAGGKLLSTLKVPHHILPLNTKNPILIWRNAQKLKKLILEQHFDLVHVHSRAPAWSVYLALKDTQIPWISTFHGAYGAQNCLKKIYNQVMLKGKAVIAPSHYIKEHIQETYHSYPDIQIISPGVDTSYFNPDLSFETQTLKEKFALKAEDKLLLFPARYSRIKGHQIALEALKHLPATIKLLFVGGDLNSSYAKTIQEQANAFQGRVFFESSQQDLRPYYNLANIVLSCTLKPESFGLIVAEAQAMGKPVIATDLGAPKEILISDKTGKIVPANNPEKLAQAVLDILQKDPTQIAHQSRTHMQENFEEHLSVLQTNELYENLLKV